MYKTGRLDGNTERLEEDQVFKSQGIFTVKVSARSVGLKKV